MLGLTRHQAKIMKNYYIYILSNHTNSVLYIGFTGNLSKRLSIHRLSILGRFSSIYKLYKLVYFEVYSDAYSAIYREKQLKKWKRSWKVELIREINPYLKDLTSEINF